MQEDEDHQAVGRADREQVERDRGRGDDDRAEDDRQQHEAQPEHVDEDERQPGVHRVDEVDVVGRVAADEHAHRGTVEGARDLGRAQPPNAVEGALARLVARDEHADRCRPAVGRDPQVAAAAEDRVVRELAPEPGDSRADARRAHVADDRDQRRARALLREVTRERVEALLRLEPVRQRADPARAQLQPEGGQRPARAAARRRSRG